MDNTTKIFFSMMFGGYSMLLFGIFATFIYYMDISNINLLLFTISSEAIKSKLINFFSFIGLVSFVGIGFISYKRRWYLPFA